MAKSRRDLMTGIAVLLFCSVPSFVFAANTRPQNGVILPSVGRCSPGIKTTITTTYTDPDGAGDILYGSLLINRQLDATNCFYVRYRVGEGFRMADDNGIFQPSPPNPIENSQAILHTSECSATPSGNTLIVKWVVTFKEKFSGYIYNCYLSAKDKRGLGAPWQKKGTWTVNRPPVAVGIIPASGQSFVGEEKMFTTECIDPDGYSTLWYERFLILDKSSGQTIFYAEYKPANKQFTILSIAPEMVEVNLPKCHAIESGTKVALEWYVAFKKPMVELVTCLYAKDITGERTNVKYGRWTVINKETFSKVWTDGYKLMVQKRQPDGTLAPAITYTMKGVCWSPASKGTSGPERDEPGMRGEFPKWVDIDVPLMKHMNANTIRTFMDFGFTGEFAKDWKYILNKCYENGIMVIPTIDRCIASLDRVEDIVNEYKDHPAILMWLVGNEWNINLFYGAFSDLNAAASAAENAAQLIQSLDPNHPVASSYGEPNIPSFNISKDIIINKCPSFDVWAFNIYRGRAFTNLFDQWKDIYPPSNHPLNKKPMFLGEFGCDAYDINKNKEDQAAQRNWEWYQWDHIRKNLSADGDSRVCIGGCVFEFNDEWWKVQDPYDPWTQQKEGWYTPNCPDGHASEEWWGLVTIERELADLVRNEGDPGDHKRAAYYMFQIFFAGGEPPPPPTPQIVRFSTQPDIVFTHLKDYPIMDVFENTSEVKINGEIVNLDEYDGFRKDVILNPGNNNFTLEITFQGGTKKSYQKIIAYDPNYSTADKKLVYAENMMLDGDNVVIDLDGNAVLGRLPLTPQAVSHNGRYFLATGISSGGEAYSTADNSFIKQLNFVNLDYASLFSNDDKRIYSYHEVLDFETNTIIRTQLPIYVSDIASDDYLFEVGPYKATKVDPVTFEIIKQIYYTPSRVIFGSAGISRDGRLVLISSYSYAVGALDIIDFETEEKVSYDLLSDFMGDVVPSYDGQKIFVGGCGNSYYGKGGVLVVDRNTKQIDSFYSQFGARRICVSPEYVFATSTCVLHNGMQGSPYHRGIEVLKLNNNSELEFQKSFFLCYPHDYNIPIRILYKKEY